MKILIEVGCLSRGGAERVASLWANGFVEKGHQVTLVLNTRKNTKTTYPIKKGILIYSIFSWIGMKLSWFFHIHWIMEWNLRRVIKRINPDVIICVLPPWAKWSRMATMGMNIPIVNTEHNSFERPDSAPMSETMTKEKYSENKKYDVVTVLTSADKLLVDGILKNVHVLPNPLAFKPAITIPQKEKIILAAGRFDDWHYKGFDILIDAWSQVASKYHDWQLHIAGTGGKKDVDFIERLIASRGLTDRISLLGFCNDMLPIYKRSSIFILSSRYEGFGMVLIEAMSQGCAPIACDYKGRQREIITSDQEGLICPPEDSIKIADAISRLIEDDDYRCLLQKNAIERSKYYSVENTMDRWEKILKETKYEIRKSQA